MGVRFFEQLLESSREKKKGRKSRLTLPVSIALHVIVLAGVVIIPLMSWGDLPEPEPGAVRAFFVESAPPPPPPPPPPPAARKAVTPKVEPKAKTPQETPRFTAPIEVPREITPDPGSDIGSDVGVPGGVPEGVEGGVQGGVPGGVVGGVPGGVVGGIPEPEATPPPPPPTTVPSGPVRVGGQIKEPRKVKNTPPVYPDIAKQARVQGTVVLEAIISPSGQVQNVRVVRGIPLLDDAAVQAVKQWQYTPTLLNGTPVAVVMTVTVNFRLSG